MFYYILRPILGVTHPIKLYGNNILHIRNVKWEKFTGLIFIALFSGDSMMRRQQYQSGMGSVTRNNQIPAQSNQNAYLNYSNGYGHQYAQQYGQHGQHSGLLYHQQQQHVQQSSMNTGSIQNIRNLRTVDLPFYNVRSVSFNIFLF